MSRADYLELDDWNAVCAECGRKFKASQLRRHWQEYWVCAAHWEPRHPQDFVRGAPASALPPWTQPAPTNSFAAVCTPNGSSAYADMAIADCVKADFISPLYDPDVSII